MKNKKGKKGYFAPRRSKIL